MLLGTLGASLLGNLLTGKGIYRAGEGIVRAGYGRHFLNSSASHRPLSSTSHNKKMDF